MVSKKSVSKTGKWLGLLFTGLALSGCASSIDDFNDGSSETSSVANEQVLEPDTKTLPKDEKVLVPGSRVNDYVNDSLPSQFAHTLSELNQASIDNQYPTIEDIPASERQLLTLEERRKLEEELSRLGGS